MNAGELHDILMQNGASLVLETVNLIGEGKVQTTKQPSYEPKTAYKLDKENTKIDWNRSPKEIHNLIRGLSPYPSAWSYLLDKDKKQKVKIYECHIVYEAHTFEYGQIIINQKELKVAVEKGFLHISKMQLPGKKAMYTKDLLNGYTFNTDAKFV